MQITQQDKPKVNNSSTAFYVIELDRQLKDGDIIIATVLKVRGDILLSPFQITLQIADSYVISGGVLMRNAYLGERGEEEIIIADRQDAGIHKTCLYLERHNYRSTAQKPDRGIERSENFADKCRVTSAFIKSKFEGLNDNHLSEFGLSSDDITKVGAVLMKIASMVSAKDLI